MAHDRSRKTANLAPAFPYEVVWESYPGGVVRFEDLEWKADYYETFNSPGLHEHLGIFVYEPESLEAMVRALELGPEEEATFHHRLKLIAGFYLAPGRQQALGIDRFASLVLLTKIARSAGELVSLLDRLPPILAGAMHFTRSGEALADRPDAPNPFELTELLRGLAKVAATHAEGAAQQRTGPRGGFVRDTMLRLTMEAMLDAGLGYPVTSAGTKQQQEPHLGGKAGIFLIKFLKLIGASLTEQQLVPVIKRLRGVMRKPESVRN